jgi:hypothetical protein
MKRKERLKDEDSWKEDRRWQRKKESMERMEKKKKKMDRRVEII